jgi:hypothetical protein
MVGVVVVGNARGPGAAGATTARGPVVRVSPGDIALTGVRRPTPAPASSWPLAAATGIGLLVASVVALVARRRSRHTA